MINESEYSLTMDQKVERAISAKFRKFLEMAVKYGVVKRGWTAADYMIEAVKNYGSENTGITGQKGTAKSNLLMQRGYIIYKDWDLVREHTITEIDPFLDLIENAIENKERIPWLGLDDVATIFPASLYFTDRKLYSDLKSSWETTRTVFANIDRTAKRKNKVASFITEDITGDIITYDRRGELLAHYDYRRWLWLRDLKDPTQMKPKLIAVEDVPFPLTPDSFKICPDLLSAQYTSGGVTRNGDDYFHNYLRLAGLPRLEFIKYWDNRLGLAKNSFVQFKSSLKEARVKKDLKQKLSQSEHGEVGAIRKKINTGEATIDDYRRLVELGDKKQGKTH
jgi:hypothetical protein